MESVGRNDLCPCGSGKKYKKCCLAQSPVGAYSRDERITAFRELESFVEQELGDEDERAFDAFWAAGPGSEDDISPELLAQSSDVFDLWFAFDRPLPEGDLVIERLLAAHRRLSVGERRFLETLRESAMHLYEIVSVAPGVSVTLCDLVEGTEVTIHERSGSRTLQPHEWLAARVVPRGASGRPEMEAGQLHITRFVRDSLLEQLKAARAAFRAEDRAAPIDAFYKTVPPLFHSAWMTSIVDPPIPTLANTDGEELLLTRVTYDVQEREALERALDGCSELERDGTTWHWSGNNQRSQSVALGLITVGEDGKLVLEVNSRQRGDRGRALLDSLGGSFLRHRATTHEDLRRRVKEDFRARARGEVQPETENDALPPGVAEAFALNHLARHYAGWLDEAIPALDGETPRAAAKRPELRDKLEKLLEDLESMYSSALRAGQPAYDPSWMWSELGLKSSDPSHPPPLAPERVDQLVPGSGLLSRSVAEQRRMEPGFDDRATVVSDEAFRSNLELQRFLREHPVEGLPALLQLMVNFDLHRRKAFWVDEALAYTLDHTELDVTGRELRVPFASFAVVFTDRHVLSIAERVAAKDPSTPVAGHLLHAVTVFVTEHRAGDARSVELAFALDTLGADLPHLIRHELRLGDDVKVETQVDAIAPHVTAVEPALPDVDPLRALLRITINAVLYATSAGVEPALRTPPPQSATKMGRGAVPAVFSSEEVYFLPGAIEISQLRRLQQLDRLPEGRSVLRRFMVRGHWRRAAANWADQRMRWVQPYWKGPDLATVIERTYKLKP